MIVYLEHYPLALAQHSKDRAVERAWREVVLGEVGVAQYDPVAGAGIIRFDYALHWIS
jgi:hypothetical protein